MEQHGVWGTVPRSLCNAPTNSSGVFARGVDIYIDYPLRREL